jgi:drug/metabolite transporter (DMT)-like permease
MHESAAMSELARYRLGLFLVTASAIAWSTAGFFTRLIHLDSWTMLVWRGLFGGTGILLFIILHERGGTLHSFLRMGRQGWIFTLISVIGMLCFITSLGFTTVAHVAIIYATVPFLAAALAWLVMRERPSASAIAAGVGALAGVGVMVGLSSEGNAAGDLLAFGMTLAMAGMMVIARHSQGIAVLQASCLSSLLSGLVSLPFAGHLWVGGPELIDLALFGLINSAIGIVLFALGSRLLPAIETGLIGSLDAPLAPIWVWLAFGETPTTTTLLGGLIVFGAVFAHILASVQRPPATAKRNAQAVASPGIPPNLPL